MTHSRRLRSLESLARDQELLTSDPPCPQCGGPREGYVGLMTYVDGGETVQECSRYGRALGKDGMALGNHAPILYLHDGLAEP